MSTDIKLSKAQISKVIQSGGLVSNLASNEINKFERKISWKGAMRAGKGFTLFLLNEDINDWNSKTWNKKKRKRISWSFVITFSHFNSATSDFFSSKRYKWKRNF